MTNLVEYVLNMRGNLPAGLDNANSSARRLNGTMDSLKGSVVSLGAAMGVTFGVAGIGIFINKVVQAGSVVENATIGLTTLLKDQAEAAQVIKNTMDDATKTPFSFEGLLAANKALISADVSAKQARTDVLNLANAIAATGGGNDELQRMVVNLQQIKNTGVATALDIKQFAYAGVNVYKVLEAAGIKTGEGIKITYEQLTKALDKAHQQGGIYFNGLENMAQSTSVKISNVGDSLFQMFNDIFIETKPLVDSVLNSTLSGISSLGEGIKKTIGFIKEHKTAIEFLITAFITYKGIMLSIIGIQKIMIWYHGLSTAAIILNTLVTEGLSAAWVALNIAMSANPIGLIIAGIAALIAGVVALTNHFGGFKNMITGVWSMIKSFVVGVGRAFMGMGEVIMGALTFNPALVRKGLMDTVNAVRDASSQIGATWQNASGKPSLLPEVSVTAKNLKKTVGGATATGSGISGTKAEGQKTINIHVAYNAPLIQGFTISTTNIKEGLQSLKEQVSAILVGATHDTLMVADY